MATIFHTYQNTTIEPTALLIGIDNKHQPSNFWIEESVEVRILSMVIYTVFWIFITYGLKAYEVGHKPSMYIGFTTGFLLLILHDYLLNYATTIAVDSQNKNFTEYNPYSQNILLDNKHFKPDKTQGLVIKNSVFEKLQKEHKINTATIQEFRDNEAVKATGAQDQQAPLKAYEHSDHLLLSGSYMFITVITACIMASHHNKKIFGSMLPFATTSGVLSVAVIGLWIVDRNYSSIITTSKNKDKIFITAFSFAFTAIITPFFFA
jgi:hypothetical protein